jgi:hypothetical protein
MIDSGLRRLPGVVFLIDAPLRFDAQRSSTV